MNKNLTSPYNYQAWVSESTREIIKTVIKTVEQKGLYGDVHFYIVINTENPNCIVPDYIKAKFPDFLTLVLQKQFYNLKTLEHGFKVDLSFNDKLETLFIPWDSIIKIEDPSTGFLILLEPQSGVPIKINLKLDIPPPPKASPKKDSVAKNNKIIKFPTKKDS